MILQHHAREERIARETKKVLILPVGNADDDVRPTGFNERHGAFDNLRHVSPNDGKKIVLVRKIRPHTSFWSYERLLSNSNTNDRFFTKTVIKTDAAYTTRPKPPFAPLTAKDAKDRNRQFQPICPVPSNAAVQNNFPHTPNRNPSYRRRQKVPQKATFPNLLSPTQFGSARVGICRNSSSVVDTAIK